MATFRTAVRRASATFALLACACLRLPTSGPPSVGVRDPAPPPSIALPSGRTGARPITDDPPPGVGGAAGAACAPQPTQDGTVVNHVGGFSQLTDVALDGDFIYFAALGQDGADNLGAP